MRRPFTSPKGLAPCPTCGNRHSFVAVSERGGEDFCEVWVHCGACGSGPGWQDRREDTWGDLSEEMIRCLAQDWNEWSGRQCHAEAMQ